MPATAVAPAHARLTHHSASPSTIDMINPAQACAALRVSEATLLEMVNHGDVAAYRLGNTVRFRRTDIQVLAGM